MVINFSEKLDKNFSLEPTKSELELPHELKSAVYEIYEKLYKKISINIKIIKTRQRLSHLIEIYGLLKMVNHVSILSLRRSQN